jgi:thiosulfate reductase cytochrome b subunit
LFDSPAAAERNQATRLRNRRRFAPSTLLLHALATLAVLFGLLTGGWQYLKGLLDVESPISMPLVYRVHYLAATLLLFVLAVVVTDWLVRGERTLLVPSGQWIRHLRSLAHELPRPLGATFAYLLGLDLKRAPVPPEPFTAYERVVSFPTWVVALGLITITGILKAMRYVYPIPGDVLYWASAIHVGAMVLLGIKVLDHLRYVLAPSRWPLMRAMWTGWSKPIHEPPAAADQPAAPSGQPVGGPA